MSNLPDFEVLVKLAKEDPEALEALRKEVVDKAISMAPFHTQRRLRGLQFQIDMERQKAKNPMDSCVKISKMMHDSFSSLRDALNDAQKNHIPKLKSVLTGKLEDSPAPIEEEVQISATVLPLKKD